MSNLIVSALLRSLIAADVQAVERGIKSRVKLIDAFIAEGIKSTDFISPSRKDSGSTASPELFTGLKEAVRDAFPEADRKLMLIESKAAVAALKPEKAARRTYLLQQIGSRMKDYKNALKRREETPEGGAGGGKRDAQTRFLDHLAKAINVLKQESDFTFDVVDVLATLENAMAMAKAGKTAKTK